MGAPLATTVPVSVAEVLLMFVAGPVVTVGRGQYCGVDVEQTPAADAVAPVSAASSAIVASQIRGKRILRIG